MINSNKNDLPCGLIKGKGYLHSDTSSYKLETEFYVFMMVKGEPIQEFLIQNLRSLSYHTRFPLQKSVIILYLNTIETT